LFYSKTAYEMEQGSYENETPKGYENAIIFLGFSQRRDEHPL